MTIPERLDELQSTQGSRVAAAARLASSLSELELLELMLLPLLAAPGLEITLAGRQESEAELLIGRSGHRAKVTLGKPGGAALVVLEDRVVALVTDDEPIRALWGSALSLSTPQLLLALQYARDDADDCLYRPAARRFDELKRFALECRVPAELLLAFAADRRVLGLAGPSSAA